MVKFDWISIARDLVERFRKFLKEHFPVERIKFKDNHLFVNSRPLLREFRTARKSLENLRQHKIIRAYFAGRFDGDGSIDKNLRNDCRIVYTRQSEAEIDKRLLKRIGITKTKVYYYRSAKTFCLYISRCEAKKFLENILPYQ